MGKPALMKSSEHAIRHLPTPAPILRAWHVVTGNGGDQTVTAHLCHTRDGVLTFERYESHEHEHFDRLVVTHAFSRLGWKELELVNTEIEKGEDGGQHHDQ